MRSKTFFTIQQLLFLPRTRQNQGTDRSVPHNWHGQAPMPNKSTPCPRQTHVLKPVVSTCAWLGHRGTIRAVMIQAAERIPSIRGGKGVRVPIQPQSSQLRARRQHSWHPKHINSIIRIDLELLQMTQAGHFCNTYRRAMPHFHPQFPQACKPDDLRQQLIPVQVIIIIIQRLAHYHKHVRKLHSRGCQTFKKRCTHEALDLLQYGTQGRQGGAQSLVPIATKLQK